MNESNPIPPAPDAPSASTAAPAPKKTIHTRTNRIFLLGVSTVLPALLTALILFKSYEFIDKSLATPIHIGLARLLVQYKKLPYQEAFDSIPHAVGFVLAFSIFFIAGFLFASFIGRRVFQIVEAWISHLPVISAIYPHAKQVVEFFASDKKLKVSGVVAFEYPCRGLYTLGFITGEGLKDIESAAKEDVVSVFIPSSPTPVSGYAIFVPKKDTIPLDVSVEEVFRYSMSAGVLGLGDKKEEHVL